MSTITTTTTEVVEEEKKNTPLRAAIVGGSLLLVGGICYFLYKKSISQSQHKQKIKQIVNESITPATSFDNMQETNSQESSFTSLQTKRKESLPCDKETCIKVLEDEFVGVKTAIMEVNKLHEELQKKNQSEDEIAQILSDKYHSLTHATRQKSITKHNTSHESMQQSVETYKNDPKIQEITQKITELNAYLSGASPELDEHQLSKIPDNLTLDKLIELFAEMMACMVSARKKAIEEIKTELNLRDSESLPRDKVDVLDSEKFRKSKEELFSKYLDMDMVINEEIIEYATKKYMHEEKFTIALQNLTDEHDKEMDKLNQNII